MMVNRIKKPVPYTRRGALAVGLGGAALLSLAGCTLPGGGKAPRRVVLDPATAFPPNMPTVAWPLQVGEPTATLSLNTARIAIGERSDIKYLTTGQWSSRAPEMVMELLVESFKNSNRILVVGDRRARIRPEFSLESRLAKFHVLEEGSKSTVVVKLECTLVQSPRRNAVGQITFEASSELPERTLDNIVAAFNESLQEVMIQAVEWTLYTGSA